MSEDIAAVVRWRVGLGVAVLWAAFWLWFCIACGMEHGIIGALIHVAPFLLFPLLVWVACHWPHGGPWGLIVIGVVIAVAYPLVARHMAPNVVVFIWLTMALPPVVSGVLMLSGRPGRL